MQLASASGLQQSIVKGLSSRNMCNFTLTKVKIFSDCVINAILDHPNCFMACTIPTTISASLDTVLRKCGNISVLERRGDDAAGEICTQQNIYVRHDNCYFKD